MSLRAIFIGVLAPAVAAALILLVLWAQPLTTIDRLFLPDDTYYTLSIARALSAGDGPSASGGILTSGFQPLTAFLMVPVFWLGADVNQALRAAILMSGIAGVAATGLIGLFVLRRTKQVWIALAGGLFAATSPLFVSNHLNGLETSLAGCLTLLAVLMADRIASTRDLRGAMMAGLVIGLAILARVDTVFVIGLIGLWTLARHGVLITAVVVGAALAVVIPWWSYCLVTFGSVVPESGGAVRMIVGYHQAVGHQGQFREVMMAALTLGTLAFGFGVVGLLGSALGIVLFMLMAVQAAIRDRQILPEAVLAVASAALLVFYVAYLPALWFFERYFYPIFLAAVLCGTIAMWRLWMRGSAPARAATGLLMGGLLTANIVGLVPYFEADDGVYRRGIDGPKGYREVAIDILRRVPAGAVIASMQTGALGYYADRGIRVVNLDGVVNGQAKAAIMKGALGDYMIRSSADYFADWERARSVMLHFTANDNACPSFRPVARIPMSLDSPFLLHRVSSAPCRQEVNSSAH